MKFPSYNIWRFVLQWAVFGLSASIMVVIVSIVYAAASWGALPTVSSGSGLTATSWNDLVTHVNQSVKQISQVITVSGSNVGIGTINPLTKLHIEDSAQIANFLWTTRWTFTLASPYTANYHQTIDFLYTSNANPTARIGVKNTGGGTYLNFGTSNNYAGGITNTAMTIDPNGNVGIGTPTPTQKLDINGAVAIHSVVTSSLTGRVQMEDNLFHIITPAWKSWEFRDDGSLWFYNGVWWVQKL